MLFRLVVAPLLPPSIPSPLLPGYDIVELLREPIWEGEASVLIGGQGTRWRRRRCSSSSSHFFEGVFSCSSHGDDEDDDVLSLQLSFRASNRRDQRECSSLFLSLSFSVRVYPRPRIPRVHHVPRIPRPHIRTRRGRRGEERVERYNKGRVEYTKSARTWRSAVKRRERDAGIGRRAAFFRSYWPFSPLDDASLFGSGRRRAFLCTQVGRVAPSAALIGASRESRDSVRADTAGLLVPSSPSLLPLPLLRGRG